MASLTSAGLAALPSRCSSWPSRSRSPRGSDDAISRAEFVRTAPMPSPARQERDASRWTE
eukprot:5734193-Pleurochrysis_carterae.AAC.3